MKQCYEQVQRLIRDANDVKEELVMAKSEICSTRLALKDLSNKLHDTKKHRNTALRESKVLHSECLTLKGISEKVQHENVELTSVIASVQNELALLDDVSIIIFNEDEDNFTFQTKSGGRTYSPAIRKLYYTLLADQIPPSKIASTIRAVLKCFSPNLHVQHTKLPAKTCAGYMCRIEDCLNGPQSYCH